MNLLAKPRDHWPFLFILSGTSLLYLAILLTSQSHVDGDEAVIGVMARHILTRGEYPVLFYGQGYGGGAAIEAFLATIPFAIFGQSSLSLKLVALSISLLTLVSTYAFSFRYLNRNAALLSAAILATATPLIEWHTKVRGGYAGLPLLSILMLFAYAYIATHPTAPARYAALLGFLAGFSLYNSVLSVSLLAALFLASRCQRRIFWRWQAARLILAGAIIGVAPLIYAILVHGVEPFRSALTFFLAQGKQASVQTVGPFFERLAAFFTGRNVDRYLIPPPPQAWIESSIQVGFLGTALYFCRGSLRTMLGSWLKFRSGDDSGPIPEPETVLVLAVIIHLALCAALPAARISPRYFLALFPALSLLAGSATERLWRTASPVRKWSAVITGLLLVSLGVANHVGYVRPGTVTDDVLLADGRIVNRQTSSQSVPAIISFLRRQGISFVRCAYFLQWRIIFESKEAIIASSSKFIPGRSRYPEYDDRVNQAERSALIFHQESAQLRVFEQSQYAKRMTRQPIYEYVIYY